MTTAALYFMETCMTGKVVSHYKILEKLGSGGMGTVYKARDAKLDRFVALKFLPPHLSQDEETKKRFIREAKAASALSHPNIATIYEIDEADGQMFIAMEYVAGQSLHEIVGANGHSPLPIADVIDYAIQIAEGLAKAHAKSIIHRDIKPANILVTEDGVVKIADFGLAKLAGATRLTKEGASMGTVAYMSPEQTQGVDVDHRADIWALGAVLYEMLTGRQPFEGDYEQAVVYSILNEDTDPVTGLRTGVPMELERIVNKALAKSPDERYQHVDELIVDLRQLKKETGSRRSLKTEVSTKTPERRARPVVVPGIILVIMILAVVGYFSIFHEAREDSSERKMLVVLPFENLGPADDDYFADGMTKEITSRLASVSGLGVISRTSAVQYAKTEKSMKQIGEELGVGYVLEGTVRWTRGGDDRSRVRITPQLIRVSDDTHLWANAYDHVIDDIFKVQSEIAQRVVEQLGITLLDPERNAVEVRPTKNLDAYQAYLRGRYYEKQPHFSLKNWQRVIMSYQKAVGLDPGFALAYAELAKAHSRLYYLRHDLSKERQEMARRNAQQALELAPDSPQVHLALSYYHLWAYRDIEQTLEELTLAERVMPNNAAILEVKGVIFELQGRWEEARDHFQRAFELSPRSADVAIELAGNLWTTRRYPQAVDACNQAIALAPNAAWPYLYKAFTYWFWKGATTESRAALEGVPPDDSWAPWAWFWQEIYEGKYREAIERLSATSGGWLRLKMWARPNSLLTAQAYELLNEPQLARAAYESARSLLEAEVRTQPDDPRYHSSLGIAYAALGHKEAAIREGKRAIEILPVSRDAFYGLSYVQDLAHIYTLLGEYDSALDQIETLLSIPSWFSVPCLEMDPRWNRLRDHPRFQELLGKYSGEGK